MELLICQFCGQIIRDGNKFCNGCGTPATKFSPTSITQSINDHSPLLVQAKAEPLVLERTINKLIYGQEQSSLVQNFLQTDLAQPQEFEEVIEPLREPLNEILPPEPAEVQSSQSISELANILSSAAIASKVALETAQTLGFGSNKEEESPEANIVNSAPAPAPELKVPSALNTEPIAERVTDIPAQTAADLSKKSVDITAPIIQNTKESSPEPSRDFFASQPLNPVPSSTKPQAAAAETSKFEAEILPPPTVSAEPATAISSNPVSSQANSEQLDKKEPEIKNQNSDFFASSQNSTAKKSEEISNSYSDYNFKPKTDSPAELISTEEAEAGQASIIQNAIKAAIDSQAKVETNLASDNSKPTDEIDDQHSEIQLSEIKKRKKSAADETEKKSSSRGLKNKISAASSDKETTFKKRSSSEQTKLEILGFSLPINVVMTASIIVVFGFAILVLISNLSSILGGLPKGATSAVSQQEQSTLNSLSGKWNFAYRNPNQSTGQGIFNLTQNGEQVQGFGVDKSQFTINGTYKNGTLQFNKQYLQGGQPAGKPIIYQGRVDGINPNPQPGQPYAHVSGIWRLTKREGMSWRAQIVSIQGQWEGALTEHGMDANSNSSIKVASGNLGFPDSGNNSPKDKHQFFFQIAVGIIGLGILIAVLSLKFFGPSGLLNIWAKKEYIPSQFKSQHNKMVREMGKSLKKGAIPFGSREEWGLHQFWLPKRLNLPPELREQNPHLLILGAGAKGKSRLMASMIVHDIESDDRSVVVIDSDGTLVDMVVSWIGAHPHAKEMSERVIIIDPTQDTQTLSYNPLELPLDGDLQNAASAVVFGFKAIYTEPPGSQSQWNQQTANILRNSAILLMANGKTLTDLPVLLSDNDFRDVLLEKVERMKSERSEYTTLLEAWSNYKRLARTDQWINWIEPILNRVQPMLGDPRIRPILTQVKGELDLKQIMREKKVLLVKIPQGQLDQNANLLGSLIVTGIKQSALSLSVRGKEKRIPCALYLDEFDTFIEKETFDNITSETRKLQIGFCGAAKTLQILPEDYRSQIIINVGTMAIFALAKKDGDMLGPQMFRVDGRKVKHKTIQNVFNQVNTSPQFELISDEEKLNIDRVVGQEERTFFCYRVGTVAGVFHMKSPDFKDIPDKDINWDIVEEMHENRQSLKKKVASKVADDEDLS